VCRIVQPLRGGGEVTQHPLALSSVDRIAMAGLGVGYRDSPARNIGALFGRGQGVEAVKHSFIVCAFGRIPGDSHERPRQAEWPAIMMIAKM